MVKRRRLFKTDTKIFFILTVSFLWFAADVVFTYVAPVYIEDKVHNLFYVGLILSAGSIAAVLVDLISSAWFFNRSYKFFFYGGFIAGLLALIFLGSNLWIMPLLLMIFGGAYYELLTFGQEGYVASQIQSKWHTRVASFLLMVTTIVSLVVPIIITPYVDIGDFQTPFILYALLMISGLVFFTIARPNQNKRHAKKMKEQLKAVSLITELKIWRKLFSKTGVILIGVVVLFILDAFFWTLGPLFAVQYAGEGFLAELFIPIYMLPGLFLGMLSRESKEFIKDARTMLASLMLAGFFLIGFVFGENLLLILTLNLFSSIFSSISYIFSESIMTRLISRMHEDGGHLIGLRGFATDIGYIIGPIVAGFIAEYSGITQGFFWLGLFVTIICFILLVKLPKDIRLPQKAVHDLETK